MAKQATGESTALSTGLAKAAIKSIEKEGGELKSIYTAVKELEERSSLCELESRYEVGAYIAKVMEDSQHGGHWAGLLATALGLKLDAIHNRHRLFTTWPEREAFEEVKNKVGSKTGARMEFSHFIVLTEATDDKMRAKMIARWVKEELSARDFRALKLSLVGGVLSNNPTGRGGKPKHPISCLGKINSQAIKLVETNEQMSPAAFNMMDAQLQEFANQSLLDTIDDAIENANNVIRVNEDLLSKLEASREKVAEELQRQEQQEQESELKKAAVKKGKAQPTVLKKKKVADAEEAAPARKPDSPVVAKKKIKVVAAASPAAEVQKPLKKKKKLVKLTAARPPEDDDADSDTDLD